MMPKMTPKAVAVHDVEMADMGDLKPHPQNYRTHPEDQLEHLAASIREHGFYRNVVVASDGTILAGHGVYEASQLVGLKQIPVTRLSIESASQQAIKILAADNTVSHLAQDDDRLLSELLKGLGEMDDLLGTGWDQQMIANYAMVTRPASEITDADSAAEWVGMPDYDEGDEVFRLIVSFTTEEDRKRFVSEASIEIDTKRAGGWQTRWPWTEREDLASLKFEGADD